MSMRYKGGVISATPPTTSTLSAPGIWTLEQQMQAQSGGNWPVYVVPGQQAYTTPGTYSWVAPAGVTTVSAVAVGPGGQVASPPNITSQTDSTYASYFKDLSTVVGYAGTNNNSFPGSLGGLYVGDGGGEGGAAGTYSFVGGSGTDGGGVGILGQGANGAGGSATVYGGTNGQAGSGGGGGGGGGPDRNGTAGGGAGGYSGKGGNGGDGTSAGFNFDPDATSGSPGSGGSGKNYGGGAGGSVNGYGGGGLGWKNNIAVTPGSSYTVKVSGNGAVRIIWAGTSGITRTFPSTNTGNL